MGRNLGDGVSAKEISQGKHCIGNTPLGGLR
jgi:hypothetical protein